MSRVDSIGDGVEYNRLDLVDAKIRGLEETCFDLVNRVEMLESKPLMDKIIKEVLK